MPSSYDPVDYPTADYYNTNAAETFRLYTSTPSPYKEIFSRIFPKGSRILDMGSGSGGRDVKTLLEMGYDGWGMDASSELVRLSAKDLNHKKRIQEGILPDGIPSDFNGDESWDGLICSALLQHIPDNLLFDTAFNIHRLLKKKGRLFITVPREYPLSSPDRDGKNRLFRIRPAEEYNFLFERVGFQLIEKEEKPDSLQREGIRWCEMVFRKRVNKDREK